MAKPDGKLASNGQAICTSAEETVSYDTEGSTGGAHSNRFSPTAQQYGELHAAYDFFNDTLFRRDPPWFGPTTTQAFPPGLPPLQPRSPVVAGYYSDGRFHNNHKTGLSTAEIGMNPLHFKGRNLIEVLQTLAHELCHAWQYTFGKPSRRGYHNKEWAAKMISIGLHPSSTGKPGGAIIGQHMSDYLIPDGPLDLAIKELIKNGFAISWYDRLADLLEVPGDATAGEDATPISMPPPKAETRPKYTCSICAQNAWAKRNASLICGKCKIPMLHRVRTPRPASKHP